MSATFFASMFRAQASLVLYRSQHGIAHDLDMARYHVRRALGLANAMACKSRIALALRVLAWLKGASK